MPHLTIALAALGMMLVTAATVVEIFADYWGLIGAVSIGYVLTWLVLNACATKYVLRLEPNGITARSSKLAFVASEISVIPFLAALIPLELILTIVFAVALFSYDHSTLGALTLFAGTALAIALLKLSLMIRHGALR